MFVPLTWPKRIVLTVLAVFQFAHPVGVPLTLGAAIAACVVAAVDPAGRRRLLGRAALMGGLCLLAAGKVYATNHVPMWVDKYAQDEATWPNAVARWNASVRGTPLHGLQWLFGRRDMDDVDDGWLPSYNTNEAGDWHWWRAS